MVAPFQQRLQAVNPEYEKFENETFYDFGIYLSSLNGSFLTCQTFNSDLILEKFRTKNKYVAKVSLEKHFFNDIIIYVGLFVINNENNLIVNQDKLLFFKVNFLEEDIKYYKSFPKFVVPLNPKMNWQIINY